MVLPCLMKLQSPDKACFFGVVKFKGDADENRYMDLMGFRKYIAIVKAGLRYLYVFLERFAVTGA